MSDFLVNELKEKDGLWVAVDDYLLFIDHDETYYHLPKGLELVSYEVTNFSKDIYYLFIEKKQFKTFKSAVKDVTKKLANKKDGYRYGINVHYQWDTGKNGCMLLATIEKTKDGFQLTLPNIRENFANGKLESDEQTQLKKSEIPVSWLAGRRVNRPIILLEKELKEVYNVKEILYSGSHPHNEKEAFLRTIEQYFSVLSKLINTNAYSSFTINHGKAKSFAGTYFDCSKEMVLQPKNYTSFFHLYWFHIYYAFLADSYGEKPYELFESLVEKLHKEETMTKHFKDYEHILNKKGEVLSKFKHKWSGQHHERFVQSHQMVARLFSDYFFYHYGDNFQEAKSKSLNFTEREIKLFSPLLEELIKEANERKKKSA